MKHENEIRKCCTILKYDNSTISVILTGQNTVSLEFSLHVRNGYLTVSKLFRNIPHSTEIKLNRKIRKYVRSYLKERIFMYRNIIKYIKIYIQYQIFVSKKVISMIITRNIKISYYQNYFFFYIQERKIDT